MTRIAINGFGRIGRSTLRALTERGSDLEVVAINYLGPVEDLARLLKFDTTLGRFHFPVEVSGDEIIIDGKPIKILAEKNPEKLPWGELDVDVVLESTGRFTKAEKAQQLGRPILDEDGFRKLLAEGPSAFPATE